MQPKKRSIPPGRCRALPFLLLTCLVAVGWEPLHASPPEGDEIVGLQPNGIVLPQRVVLEPLRPRELVDGPATQLVSLPPFSAFPAPPGLEIVNRSAPSLWRLRLQLDDQRPTIVVGYEVRSAGGVPGYLSLAHDSQALLPVRVESVGPRIRRQQRGVTLVTGGASFFFSVNGVTRPGNYRGTLSVTINQL